MRTLANKNIGIPLLLLILMAASSVAQAGKIDLEVDYSGSTPALKVVGNDVSCNNDKHCIKTNKGQKQDLEFRLKKACGNNGPEYRLSGMQFSMVQREPASNGSGDMVKAFGHYEVPAVVAADFGTDSIGNVLWTGSNSLKDHMINLKNKNQGEYVVFFQIEATHCENTLDVIYLDPRVENTGR